MRGAGDKKMNPDLIRRGVDMILEGLGEDVERDGLSNTPERVAAMYQEILYGTHFDLSTIVEPMPSDKHQELVLIKDIPFHSVCEHHLTPFFGMAHVAYIPSMDGSITGLSKLARLVKTAAAQLQLQERLTSQIADTMVQALEPEGVMVRVSGLDTRAANILKQEMRSRGGEVATSREVYELGGKQAECLIMGTLSQYDQLIPKLKAQPFGLRALAEALGAVLQNSEDRPPHCHPGLDLTDRPLIMGAINVTPDSFSSYGEHEDPEVAVKAAWEMVEQGAHMIDVGGESTRPGSDRVSVQEDPVYRNVVEDVYSFFMERLETAVEGGLEEENLLLDVGIGFGKNLQHNLDLLRNMGTFRSPVSYTHLRA